MRTVTLHDYKRRMLRVLVHIQQHPDESLQLEELAGLACFSPYHFHRVFEGMVGESVKEYVRRLLLELAASRLKLGSASVVDIALGAGYDSQEAFTDQQLRSSTQHGNAVKIVLLQSFKP
jgi:AraC family transcriptional regulator